MEGFLRRLRAGDTCNASTSDDIILPATTRGPHLRVVITTLDTPPRHPRLVLAGGGSGGGGISSSPWGTPPNTRPAAPYTPLAGRTHLAPHCLEARLASSRQHLPPSAITLPTKHVKNTSWGKHSTTQEGRHCCPPTARHSGSYEGCQARSAIQTPQGSAKVAVALRIHGGWGGNRTRRRASHLHRGLVSTEASRSGGRSGPMCVCAASSPRCPPPRTH